MLEVERGIVTTPDLAAPLGLLVNGFVTGSLKHAFGSGFGGRPALRDDERGLPAGATAAGVAGGGTGMRGIGSLARRVGSPPEWGAGPGGKGARLALSLRLPQPPPRG